MDTLDYNEVQYKKGAHGFIYMRVLDDWRRSTLTQDGWDAIVKRKESYAQKLKKQHESGIKRGKKAKAQAKAKAKAKAQAKAQAKAKAITRRLKGSKRKTGQHVIYKLKS